jgi:hypothetical protein
VEPFRGVKRPRDMWRGFLLGIVLAGVLAGCSRDGANGGLTGAASFSYRAIQRNAAFHFHVPRNAAQYEPVGGNFKPVKGSASVWLSYRGPDGFVSLWEGNQRHPNLLRAMTGGAVKLRSEQIGGLTWDHYRHADDILVHVFPDGVTVGVRTGSIGAERSLAAQIQ